MTLVDDYLRAVAILLPKAQRDDIVAELRDMILTRIEALESEKGRPLTDDEVEQVLRDVGHPLVVAARYRDGPQHAVGPTLYPYWIFAVKIAVAIQLVVAAIVFLARSLTGGDVARAFGLAVGSGVSGAMMLIGIATAVAWVVERQAVHIDYLDHWRVRDLRLLEFGARNLETWRGRSRAWLGDWRSREWLRDPSASAMDAPGPRPTYPRRRGSAAAQGLSAIATGLVVSLWWTGVLRFGLVGNPTELTALGVDPGPLARVDWVAIQAALYWPVLGYCLAIILRGALLLAWPGQARLRGLLDLAIGAGVLGVTAWLWAYSPLAAAVQVDSVSGFFVRMKTLLEHGVPVALAPIVTMILVATAIGGLSRVIRGVWELLVPEAESQWTWA